MIKRNIRCRMCGSNSLIMFLDLQNQPPANRNIPNNDWVKNPEPLYPLKVYFCYDCNLVQLLDVVAKEDIFKNYPFISSGVGNTPKHFREYAEEIQTRFLNPENLVVEIGGNDGVLLKELKNVKTLNVEPAENIALIAESRGIKTIADFWSSKLARQIKTKLGVAKLILGNNSIPHIDDQLDVTIGIKELLAEDGIYIVQAHYLGYIFDTLGYGDVYHEHLSYFAIRPLISFYRKFGMNIFDYKLLPFQGTSIRLYIGNDTYYSTGENVKKLAEEELAKCWNKPETYMELAEKVKKSKDKLVSVLRELTSQDKKIAAYGAAAKGMTILNYAGITNKLIDFCVDDLPQKQGLYTPMSHIPIISRDEARKKEPDYYLLLAWNFKDFILEREKHFVDNGGKFIMPIGDIEIMPK